MLSNVIAFLKETKISYKQFDRLISFYEFKNEIAHKQNFTDVCNLIAEFFAENFYVKNLKITTYDIEHSREKVLYLKGESFNENFDQFIFSYDFSKSYSLNGRIFFQVDTYDIFNKVNNDKLFLDFILYEIKHIIANNLAIRKIKETSFVDDVTGLPNRKFLVKHLNYILPIAQKEGLEVAFLKIDVDRFKAVLEEFNYSVGNKVLKKLAEILQKNITYTDVVTRFEANTFMICMQDIKEPEEAGALANKCIEEFALQETIVDTKTCQTLLKTISVGIAIYPNDTTDVDEIFRYTDIALDEAKNKGRSSYEFYQNEQNSSLDLF